MTNPKDEAATSSKDEAEKLFDMWAAKSKRICAVCDVRLAGLRPPKDFQGRVWCSHLKFIHPTKKSKRIAFCGECYARLKSYEATNEQ